MSVSRLPLFERIFAVIRPLTRPVFVTDDFDDFRRAHFLSVFILSHLVINLITLSLRLLTGYAQTNASFETLLLYTVLVGGCYVLSRTSHYRLAALLYIVAFYGLLLSLTLTDMQASPERTLNLTIVSVLIASLTLSVRTTIGVGLVGAALIALIPSIAPAYPHVLAPALNFHLFVSLLIIVSAWVRRRDYNNLQESENRYRDLMDATMESIIISDQKGFILDCNPAFEELIKFPLKNLRGRQMVSFVVPEAHESIRLWFRNQETSLYEADIVTAQGERRNVEILTRACIYRGESARVTVARDITQRKHSERQRREFELRYRALLHQTLDAVLILDMQGVLLGVNGQASRMLGVPDTDLIGQQLASYIVHDDEPARSQQRLQKLKQGERIPVYERLFQRADGSQFTAEVSLTLVRDEENESEQIQIILRDVSERKNAEQQAFELALQRERVKVLQKFISDASHHFRTPLANLNTASYLLQRLHDKPHKQRHQFKLIRSEVKRLDQLLDDLLTVIRLEKESSEAITQVRFSVNDLLKERVAAVQREYAAAAHEWETLPYRDLLFRGNPYRLGQAISSVLDNAARYTPAGGHIIARCYERDRHIIVEVKDSGIGIPEDERGRIFEYFYRTDAAREIDASRNGLGLSISHKIMAMHNGRIEVSAAGDNGSVIRLLLPLSSMSDAALMPVAHDEQT